MDTQGDFVADLAGGWALDPPKSGVGPGRSALAWLGVWPDFQAGGPPVPHQSPVSCTGLTIPTLRAQDRDWAQS